MASTTTKPENTISDETTARIVKEFNAGRSITEIADGLASDKVPAPGRQSSWTRRPVAQAYFASTGFKSL